MMAEGKERISEKEKIMFTGGQNRKTTNKLPALTSLKGWFLHPAQ